MLIKCNFDRCLHYVGGICVRSDYKHCPYYILKEREKEKEKENES